MCHHFILDNNIIIGVSLGAFDIFVPPLDDIFVKLLFFSTTNKLVGNRTLDRSAERAPRKHTVSKHLIGVLYYFFVDSIRIRIR